MTSEIPAGTPGQSLRGPVTDERLKHVPQEALELIGAETVNRLESSLDEIQTLNTLRSEVNPFNNRRGNQVDVNQFEPQFQTDLNKLFAKKQKAAAIAKKMSGKSYRLFIKTLQAQEKQISQRARQANESLRTYHAEEMFKLHEEVKTSDETFDIERIQSMGAGLEDIAVAIPTKETISSLESLWDVCIEHPRLRQAQLERAPSKIPGHRVIVGGFRLLQTGENRMMEVSRGSLRLVRRIADTLSSNGSKAFDFYQSIVTMEEIKRLGDVSELLQLSKEDLLRQFSESDPADVDAYLAAEKYLIDVATYATDIFKKEISLVNPKEHDDYDEVYPQIMQEIEDLLTPHIANAIEAAKMEVAANFSKRITEANDIIVGGRRLKPNKKLRQPDVLSDSLDKVLNGEGQAYRTEKGMIIAMLSGRFDSFVNTIRELQHPEAKQVIEGLRELRGRVVDDLIRVDLDVHMGNLEVIMMEYVQGLEQLLSPQDFNLINGYLQAYFNKREETESAADSPDFGSNKLLEDVFEREDLIGILDWTILPIEKGEEELEKAARDIVSQAQERAKRGTHVEIDLARLNILKNLRELWGKDRCEYFRGKLRSSGVVEGSDRPDEYIVLVMRELDEQGNIKLEHAVAESPIAGDNALYLLRGDVAAGSWREVFSLYKKDARALGARKLLHTKGDGRPMVEFLTDRVQTLLTCSPEEFFRIRFQGSSYWMQKLGIVDTPKNLEEI